VFGLGRTGSAYSNGSGDFAIAFLDVARHAQPLQRDRAAPRQVLPTDATSPLFEAALEAPRKRCTTRCSRRPRAIGERHGRGIPIDTRSRAAASSRV
jgi:D-aminopeptidase